MLNRTSNFTLTFVMTQISIYFSLSYSCHVSSAKEKLSAPRHTTELPSHLSTIGKWKESLQVLSWAHCSASPLDCIITTCSFNFVLKEIASLRLKPLLLATDTIAPFGFYLLLLQIWAAVNKIKAMNFSPQLGICAFHKWHSNVQYIGSMYNTHQ